MTESGRPPIGLRHVVLVTLAAAVVVLGLQVLSALVPGLGDALDYTPLVIAALIAVTGLVLFQALRPRR